MGIEAAMMVMALSAVARMTSWVVASVKSELPMPGRVVIFIREVMPALGVRFVSGVWWWGTGVEVEGGRTGGKPGGGSLQDAHAHCYEDAEFLFLVHGEGPDYLPGDDG